MLNTEQKRAIEILDKPLVVIAGPGTGKTKLITEKIDYLLSEKNYSSDDVLAITFTKKAAKEMSERVELNSSKPFFAKTFHEFALELIDNYQKYIPQLDKDYVLINETNQLLFFLDNLSELKFSSIEIKNNHSMIAHDLVSTISKLKDFGVKLLDVEKIDFEDKNVKMDVFVAYSKYEVFKKENNYLDFSDVLLYVLDMLKKYPEIRDEIKNKYKYILVDEFQDTNKVQLDILKLISDGSNLTIVGDQKQSIYGFRGANFSNLSDFKKHYSDYVELFLNQNYRSSNKVLDTVNNVINKIGSEKELLNNNFDYGGDVKMYKASNTRCQNSFIAQKISKINELDPGAKVGVLFRRKSELRETVSYLRDFGIDFNASEAYNFFETEIIRNVLKQLRIISRPNESQLEFFKLFEDIGLRGETIKKILRLSKLREKPILKVLSADVTDFKDEREIIENVMLKLDKILRIKNSKNSLYVLVREVLFEFNDYQKCIIANDFEGISNLNYFLNFVKDYMRVYRNSDLDSFITLCENSKKLDINYDTESVSNVELLTVHSSKGKEFDYVIIPFMNERRFPSNYKRSKFEALSISKEDFIEEEKRLFFVAISRAKKELDILYVNRFDDNKYDSKCSPFLNMLDIDICDFEVEFDDFDISQKEKSKLDSIKKINDYLLDDNYDKAKVEIEKLRLEFGKKDLNFYFKGGSSVKKKDIDDVIENQDFSNHVFSVSQIKTYETCPRKYMYQYIYKVPSLPKHYFDFGTSVHSVLESLVFDFGKLSKEQLFSKGISLLKKGWISKGYIDVVQEREYFEKGIKAIKDFIKKEYEIIESGREIDGIEKKFIIDVEGRKILGFIDRIDKVGNEYMIYDYKTSNSVESQKDMINNIQLFVYSLALKDMKGILPKRVGLWYLIHNKIVDVEVSNIHFDNMREKVVNSLENIEKKKFDATPSMFNCRFCDYNEICSFAKK